MPAGIRASGTRGERFELSPIIAAVEITARLGIVLDANRLLKLVPGGRNGIVLVTAILGQEITVSRIRASDSAG